MEYSEMKGAFVESLKRSAKDIKQDRAESVAEDLELSMSRTLENTRRDLKKLTRKRSGMLDLSPQNTISLIMAESFDADGFSDEYLRLGLEIRELEIKLEVAQKSYNHLFGGE